MTLMSRTVLGWGRPGGRQAGGPPGGFSAQHAWIELLPRDLESEYFFYDPGFRSFTFFVLIVTGMSCLQLNRFVPRGSLKKII